MKNKILKLLPERAKCLIVVYLKWLDLWVARLCVKHGRLASFYYLFFSRRFDREHITVLRGRLAYEHSLTEMGQSSPLLRRNIHRLEKGLIMRPRRKVFAEEYILETVRCYNSARARYGFSGLELQWARDVLNEYFNVVETSPIVEKACGEFDREMSDGDGDPLEAERTLTPYAAHSLPNTRINFDDLVTLFTRRRSTRWYEAKSVPEEWIERIVNAAALAPSACNRQPFRFIFTNDSNYASRIAECAGGTTGFAQQVPAIIVVVGDLSAYPFERDRHLIYIDASLASMQLMLAAEIFGLATCPINWPDVDRAESRLQRILPLASHERVIMLIAIGFADSSGEIPYSQKKDASSLLEMIGPNDF